MKLTGIFVAAVLIIGLCGCASTNNADKKLFDAKALTCLEPYTLLKENLVKDNYEGAYLLFSDAFREKYAQTPQDFKILADKDRGLIIASKPTKGDEGLDYGWATITYGDKKVYVHFVVSDVLPGHGKVWQITTKDNYMEVKNRTLPEKTFQEALPLLAFGKFDLAQPFLTRQAAQNIDFIRQLVLVFYNAYESGIKVENHKFWIVWTVSAKTTDGGTRPLSICFVKRLDRWLIAMPDELSRVREIYGDER